MGFLCSKLKSVADITHVRFFIYLGCCRYLLLTNSELDSDNSLLNAKLLFIDVHEQCRHAENYIFNLSRGGASGIYSSCSRPPTPPPRCSLLHISLRRPHDLNEERIKGTSVKFIKESPAKIIVQYSCRIIGEQ